MSAAYLAVATRALAIFAITLGVTVVCAAAAVVIQIRMRIVLPSYQGASSSMSASVRPGGRLRSMTYLGIVSPNRRIAFEGCRKPSNPHRQTHGENPLSWAAQAPI